MPLLRIGRTCFSIQKWSQSCNNTGSRFDGEVDWILCDQPGSGWREDPDGGTDVDGRPCDREETAQIHNWTDGQVLGCGRQNSHWHSEKGQHHWQISWGALFVLLLSKIVWTTIRRYSIFLILSIWDGWNSQIFVKQLKKTSFNSKFQRRISALARPKEPGSCSKQNCGHHHQVRFF